LNGKIDGSGGLKRASVKHVFNAINGALEQAVKNNMISQNLCKAISLPKNDKGEVLYFTPEQANQFLETVKNYKHYLLYSLELITGLRLGEIVALRWENVFLTQRRLK
jgi:integrase